jgi:hypothetical protein
MLTGKQTFKAKLRRAVPTVEAKINAVHREVVRRIFTDLVLHSPQWSGNLASNWYVGSGSYRPTPGYSPGNWGNANPYSMGSDPAVSTVLKREAGKIAKLSYRQPIKILNAAPYASEVEAGQGPNGNPIRELNKLEAYGGVAMIGYADMKYNQLKSSFKSWGQMNPTLGSSL